MSNKVNRFIDLEKLPRKGNLYYFVDSIGLKIHFIYNDIDSVVEINDYNPKNHMLKISFPYLNTDSDYYFINTDNFKKIKFGRFINKNIFWDYKYNVSDVVKNNMGDVTILSKETKYVGANKDIARKYYYIECNRCGCKRWLAATDLHNNRITYCNQCGITIPYPEKFMISVLKQLHVTFKTQYKFDDKNYYYDFYLKDYNIIIETHGNQHYNKVWNTSKKTLSEIQENDANKYNFAINKVNDYIIIDCRKSKLEWIKNSIINSKMNDIFDITSVDWNKCDEYATSDYVYISSELKNKGYTKKEISNILSKSINSVSAYLKEAHRLNMCEDISESRNVRVRLVYNDLTVDFKSITDCIKWIKENIQINICKKTIKKYALISLPYKEMSFYLL